MTRTPYGERRAAFPSRRLCLAPRTLVIVGLIGAAAATIQLWPSDGALQRGSRTPALGSIRLDLNCASAAEFATLPMVGPALGRAIVAHREKHGRFASVNGVDAVSGIGPSTLEALRGYLVVVDSAAVQR